MKYQHQQLAQGGWQKLSFFAQMANIGSEVERAISWQEKGNKSYSQMAFERALELLQLTLADSRNKNRLKELCRLYEMLVDYFAFANEYKSTAKSWHNYFFPFNFASRIGC